MVHKPKHKVHSFRGLLGDGGQDEIRLERSNVNLAYRIVKFRTIGKNPGASPDQESITKIYRESQSSIDAVVNFTDTNLLGVSLWQKSSNIAYPVTDDIIFDNVLFSRNIYVTLSSQDGSEDCNYYIELEEVPVGAATLMQIKLGSARRLISDSMGA